jgi:adenylate cyclase
MVTDPVCGMRIDPADAVATAVHDGTTTYFCSQACHDIFVADIAPSLASSGLGMPERLTLDEIAVRAGIGVDRARRLEALGIIQSERGTFDRRDVMRARVAAHLESVGIEPEALSAALASGDLRLGYIESAGRRHPRVERSFAEISGEVGVPLGTLERTYMAFGLPPPHRDEPVRQEDLEAIRMLPILFGTGVDERDVLRFARVMGDSTRRVAQYLPHHFHAAVEEQFRGRGMRDNEAFETAIREVGLRLGRSGEDLLGWLFRRHSEVYMTEHQFEHVETALEDAGARRRPPRQMEAVAFADLVGFTNLTDEAGDEAAADTALRFADLVSEIAVRNNGSLVKLMGDGALLHFRDPADAVRCALDIVDQTPSRGLPPAHIGVNSGPMLYDEGDYFGQTVNIAARIAAQAGAAQTYVGEALAERIGEDGFGLTQVGEFQLKGVARPVMIYEATRSTAPPA